MSEEEPKENTNDFEVEVKPVVSIADGAHKGVIVEVSERLADIKGKSIKYVDVFIETKDMNGEIAKIKFSMPERVSEKTDLGILLQKMGAKLIPNEKIKPAKILIGKKITFNTRTNENDFAEVDKKSIKLAE